MNARIARLAVGVLIAATPAFARPSKPVAAAAAPATLAKHRRDNAALPSAPAVMPDSWRLAVQADLAWLGHFDGMSAEEADGHTADAIKAFQHRTGGKETGSLNEQERVLLAEAAKPRQARVGWRLIDDSATGARLGIPEKLVLRAGAVRVGSRWSSAGGQVEIETFGLHEASLPSLFEQEKKTLRRRIAYSALGPDSFVIIGEQRLKKLVIRAQSSGSEVRGVTVLYDQATEGTMAPIAVALADSFVGFPERDLVSPGPNRRGVEYGTAVAVTADGDLVAPAEATDRCQSLTVPGFGHADRVAADKAAGLALLRLYGAHGLVAAPLAGDGIAGMDVTLFGIADPPTQSGGGAVTEVAAQITAQGIAPVPPSGFAGAPAVDGRGNFAGLIVFQSPDVAGIGPAPPRTTLLPAAAVRAFLGGQGIAPAVGRDPIGRSVVRVICVRK